MPYKHNESRRHKIDLFNNVTKLPLNFVGENKRHRENSISKIE